MQTAVNESFNAKDGGAEKQPKLNEAVGEQHFKESVPMEILGNKEEQRGKKHLLLGKAHVLEAEDKKGEVHSDYTGDVNFQDKDGGAVADDGDVTEGGKHEDKEDEVLKVVDKDDVVHVDEAVDDNFKVNGIVADRQRKESEAVGEMHLKEAFSLEFNGNKEGQSGRNSDDANSMCGSGKYHGGL